MSLGVDTSAFDTRAREPHAPVSRNAIRALSIMEARRYLTSASVWIGLAATTVLVILPNNDYAGQAYADRVPVSIGPFAFGVFLAALRAGRRDRAPDHPPLAEESPLDASERALARVIALVVPIALAIVTVVAIAILSKVQGGFWLGDEPRRTDHAQHSFLELLQPILLVALLGAAGVALGRCMRRTTPAAAAGAIVWFLFFFVWWAWNSPGMHVFAPAQVAPMSIRLPVGTDPTRVPTGWLLHKPDEYNGYDWYREVVHLPTVAWHNVYLLGIVAVLCGAAIRRTIGRRLMAGGLILAVVGVTVQLVVSPY